MPGYDPQFLQKETGVKLKNGLRNRLTVIMYCLIVPSKAELTGLPLTASPKHIALHAAFSCLI